MKFLEGNVAYDFTVTRNDDDAIDHDQDHNHDDECYRIDLHFRKRHHASPDVEEIRRTLRSPRGGGATRSAAALVAATLRELLEVRDDRVLEDMSLHFQFHLDRDSRRRNNNNNNNNGSTWRYSVRVESVTIAAERAAAIRRRMEAVTVRERRREAGVVAAPARKAVVEGLERERVSGGDDVEERECGICLERYEEGVEVIRMPCLHVYHKDCILKWLDRTHFCPFCRFKLPVEEF